MQKKHLVYIVSHIQKSLAFEWIAARLHHEYRLTFLLLNPGPSPLESFLRGNGIEVRRVNYRGKVDFLQAFLKTFLFLVRKRADVVHAHLLDAQLVGLSAAWLAGIRKRVYTRHTSTYHHRYAPSGVKYDKFSNRLATHIISISQATDTALKDFEGVPEWKIVKIPHGFDWRAFDWIDAARILEIRSKWKIPEGRPTIGVISRFIEWKGVQYTIPAFRLFLRDYPEAHLVLANANGPFREAIIKLLEGIDPTRLTLVPFEEDVAALYRVFDLFVHVPVDPLLEAFGQTYVEALASGVPSIFTRSGIAAEFVEHERNALVVPFQDSSAILGAMNALWKNELLRQSLVTSGKDDVASRFGIDIMISSLKDLYHE